LFVFLYGILAYMLLCIFRVIISRMMKKMSFFQTPVLIVACSPVILYLGSIWAAG